MHTTTLLFISLFFLFPLKSYAKDINLVLPILDDSPNLHAYFHELITLSLQDIGYTPKISTLHLPQSRAKSYLDNGQISAYWLIASTDRNNRYLPIKIGLTNGLIGKRILFIKKGKQSIYDDVLNLDDFRSLNLIGAMGHKWYDIDIWKFNQLKYKEKSGNWENIFPRVAVGRDYDYFSRGINEIIIESKQYPNLAIEKRIALEYDKDFYFYLSNSRKSSGKIYYRLLNQALIKAKASGLIDRLVEKHWGENIRVLNYQDRIKIKLESPN